jgi:predicted nucleic acid-binding protein
MEDGSDIIRRYLQGEPTQYTTLFCYFEALNVLKVKWLYKKEIPKDAYHEATFSLTAWFSYISKRVPDIDFTSAMVLQEVLALSDRYSVDLSDAFQILSVKKVYFSPFSGDSKTVLVTADKTLAKIARVEGIKAWYFLTEPKP